MTVSATWGAGCGKSARRVLRGGTGTRSHAGSVRPLPRKGQLRRGSAKATAPRPVPTSHRVHHQRLVARLETRVTDRRLIALIQRMLKAKVVMSEGVVVNTDEGVPQGGPLSPLLSNIVLDELDRELAQRGYRFVRYADDAN